MPRKKLHKRSRKLIIEFAKERIRYAEQLGTRIRHIVDNFESACRQIEASENIALTKTQQEALLASIFLAAIGPAIFATQRRRGRPGALPRDFLVVTLRAVLRASGCSTSLSFTDSSQTEIDQPFARSLTALWKVIPPAERGKSSSALIYRARKLRTIWPEMGDTDFMLRMIEAGNVQIAGCMELLLLGNQIWDFCPLPKNTDVKQIQSSLEMDMEGRCHAKDDRRSS